MLQVKKIVVFTVLQGILCRTICLPGTVTVKFCHHCKVAKQPAKTPRSHCARPKHTFILSHFSFCMNETIHISHVHYLDLENRQILLWAEVG